MYELVQLFTVLSAVLVVYTVLALLFFAAKYVKTYTHNKRLIFTRDSIKDLRAEIRDVMIKGHDNDFGRPINLKFSKQSTVSTSIEDKISIIVSLYNEFAVGINEGLYDELYVKTVIGREMTDFYKAYYTLNTSNEDDSCFIPLELLLKRWDSKDAPVYIEKKRGK